MSNYWVAFLIVMGISNLAGFGVIAYLKHEKRKRECNKGEAEM
jgi:general stress protein CsbA